MAPSIHLLSVVEWMMNIIEAIIGLVHEAVNFKLKIAVFPFL